MIRRIDTLIILGLIVAMIAVLDLLANRIPGAM